MTSNGQNLSGVDKGNDDSVNKETLSRTDINNLPSDSAPTISTEPHLFEPLSVPTNDEFETEDEPSPIDDTYSGAVPNEFDNVITNRRSSLTDFHTAPIAGTFGIGSGLGSAFREGFGSYSTSADATCAAATTAVSPPSITRSPIKSPNSANKLLPPIPPGSLKISKRRRLEPISSSPFNKGFAGDDSYTTNNNSLSSSINRNQPDDPLSFHHSTITPIKQRSFSTPLKSIGRRTPSLQDKPIPVLSPPVTQEEAEQRSAFAIGKALSLEMAIPSVSADSPSKHDSIPSHNTPSSDSSSSSSFIHHAQQPSTSRSPFASSPPSARNRSVTMPALLMKAKTTTSPKPDDVENEL